jgi:hypothetical protein
MKRIFRIFGLILEFLKDMPMERPDQDRAKWSREKRDRE